ncbi:prenyltransferase/squalene oxidase repeat-containing protein [Aquimarina sp. 2201CG1-2-11]|uniref:prenyltransferase/squalene oxidase repeat-containing protein n=1 Tax=Aquimarina discodermiae TaxID=3231043 RepID=UPI00346348B6
MKTTTISTNPFPETSRDIIETIVDDYKKYIANQHWKPEAKDHLTSNESIYTADFMYLYYPLLFNKAFGVFDQEQLSTICLAGYFCFASINTFDDVIDAANPSEIFEKYVFSSQMLEESMKLLSKSFFIDSEFWKYWMLRKKEFSDAYKKSKQLDAIKVLTDYEVFADNKSAFAKLAIDSLYLVSSTDTKNEIHTTLLQSHKHFSTSMQILDDILDLPQDLEDRQFNILRFALEEANYGITEDVDEMKSFLYQSRSVSQYLEYAIEQTNKAIKVSREVTDLPLWEFTINNLKNRAINKLLNIDGYLKVYESKSKVSSKSLKKKLDTTSTTIESILEKGIDFIFNQQETLGNWFDYYNSAGLSDTWATSFILATLPKNYLLSRKKETQLAYEFIKKECDREKGWGYNSRWIPDADSTSFAMLALLNTEQKIDATIIENWYSYQKQNGGFATYKDQTAVQLSINSPGANVDGWIQTHFCVSATAYYVMAKTQVSTKDIKLMNIREYLLQTLQTDQEQTYWWTDTIYTYNFLIKGAVLLGDTEVLNTCSNYIKKKYLIGELPKDIRDNNFYQGLLLDAICSHSDLFEEYNSIAMQLMKKLLQNQKEDGSWQGTYSLRIPSPTVIDPDKEVLQWKEGTIGTNTLFMDFQHLFTTAVCSNALHCYQNRSEPEIFELKRRQ